MAQLRPANQTPSSSLGKSDATTLGLAGAEAPARPPAVIFLTSEELARRWRISPRTLQRWRRRRRGPACIEIEGSIRYRMADIREYEERQRRASVAVSR
jgi:Helix-turn-helix domain